MRYYKVLCFSPTTGKYASHNFIKLDKGQHIRDYIGKEDKVQRVSKEYYDEQPGLYRN